MLLAPILTTFLSDKLPRVAFVLDARLNNQGIVAFHLNVVLRVVGLLYVVACVVDTACSDIATRSFQRVGSVLHLAPLFAVDSVGYLLHAHAEGHALESGQHRKIEVVVATQRVNWSVDVHGLRHVQIVDLDVAWLFWPLHIASALAVLLWCRLLVSTVLTFHNSRNLFVN